MCRKDIKIWAASDMHGNLSGLYEDLSPFGCDIAIIAGDAAPLSRMHDALEQVRWWNTSFAGFAKRYYRTQFVIVPGNHDILFECDNLNKPCLPDNCHIIVDSGVEIEGVKIYGTPWVPYINGFWAFEDCGDGADLAEHYSRIPSGVDILVTHSPPFIEGSNIDVSLQYTPIDGSEREHFGSSELTKVIAEKCPKMVFCGHIHSGDHSPVVMCDGKTVVRNVSRVDETYKPAYKPAICGFVR